MKEFRYFSEFAIGDDLLERSLRQADSVFPISFVRPINDGSFLLQVYDDFFANPWYSTGILVELDSLFPTVDAVIVSKGHSDCNAGALARGKTPNRRDSASKIDGCP